MTDKLLFNKATINLKENAILFETSNKHDLKNNDCVRLQNAINNNIFTIDKYVTVIDDTHFQIEYFNPYYLYLDSVKEINISDGYHDDNENALLLTFNKAHEIMKKRNRDFITVNLIDKRLINETVVNLKQGNTILINDIFLYEVKEDGILPPYDKYENIRTELSVLVDGNFKKLYGLVPINIDGMDDQFNIICFLKKNDKSLIDYIKNNSEYVSIIKEDTRFIEIANNAEIILQENVEVYKLKGDYHIEIPIKNAFATNLFQTDNVMKDFVDKESEKAINRIVNMEKYCFSPVCRELNDDYDFLPINEINFNFHFRDRNGNENWVTDDSKYWNSYSLKDDKLIYKSNNFFAIDQSDLLGYLDYTNQDVLYQKNKLKKSFVRLSFYDSRDINTQKLLYYSTIFVDSGKLFGKYTNNLNNLKYTNINGSTGVGVGVYNEYMPVLKIVDETRRLSTHLSIYDRYNNDASSEGFYLYLFSETSPKYEPVSIYMKVEYNHAGYGRTVPFIMPTLTNESGEVIPIDPIGENGFLFPITYKTIVWSDYTDKVTGSTVEIKDDDKDAYLANNIIELKEIYANNPKTIYKHNDKYYILTDSIDMTKLYDDLFIEIKIKYDYKKNQYIWFMPRYIGDFNGSSNGKYNGKLVFNLFEPKIQ